MSALKMAATTLWTKLLDAMRNDGIIAACITQSGPQTTAVIVEACEMALTPEQAGAWLPMSIHSTEGREVVALDEHGCIHAPVEHSPLHGWLWNGSAIEPSRFTKWTYVRLPTQENKDVH